MAGTRSRTLTEKGVSLYESLFDGHRLKVQKKKLVLDRYLDMNYPSMPLRELSEYKDSLVLSMADYEDSVSSFMNFLNRNRNENSDLERLSINLIYTSIKGRFNRTIIEIDTLVNEAHLDEISKPQEILKSDEPHKSSVPGAQENPNIKSKLSRQSSRSSSHKGSRSSLNSRSSSSTSKVSVLYLKQKAEMEAKKVKLKAAMKEAEILQKQAALQADLAILTAQQELDQAEVKHRVFMEELTDNDSVSDMSNDLDSETSVRTNKYVEDQNQRLASTVPESLPMSISLQDVVQTVPSNTTPVPHLQSNTEYDVHLPYSVNPVSNAATTVIPDKITMTSPHIGIPLQAYNISPGLASQSVWSTPHHQPVASHAHIQRPTPSILLGPSTCPQLSDESLPVTVVPTPIVHTGVFRTPMSKDNLGISTNSLPGIVTSPLSKHSIEKQLTSKIEEMPFQDTSDGVSRTGVGVTLNPQASVYMPASSNTTEAQAFTSFLLKKELLFSRLSKFQDTPETYLMWKSSFQSILKDLVVTPMEEMDLLVKWLGPNSSRQAASLRSSNPLNPSRGVRLIWERLDQRYGSPEVIEDTLKRKLDSFTKLTKFDTSKFYDLLDVLSEIDANMQNLNYKDLLSYYNSSSGIIPIVNKLPQGIQEKWTTRPHKYKQDYQVPYPPFSYFRYFISDVTRMKNDPGFQYEQSVLNVRCRTQPVSHGNQTQNRTKVNTQKTDVTDTDSKQPFCPFHRTNHKLNKCREFRKLSIEDRKKFLRKNSICFKCCRQEKHLFKNCNATVKCEVCQSSHHPTALHVDSQPEEHIPDQGGEQYGGEQTAVKPSSVKSLCSQVCRDESGYSKSCAKTVLVRVYPNNHPERALRLYAIIDDQSNQSLARSTLFDHFDVHDSYVEYSMASCSGVVSTAGRKADGFTVEAIDGSASLQLPTLFECDQIPNARHEIPVPEAALYHPHLRELVNYIPALDPNADILLLIGRDLPAAHHVLDQKIGPMDGPIGQHLKLGWVIIGEVCLGNAHQPHVTTNKTHILANGRPSNLLPCPNCFEVKTDEPGFNIFERTMQDDKPGLSMEDKEFLHIMESNFAKDPDGNWEAPLPFKLDRSVLSNNRTQAVRRALSLDASLRKDPNKCDDMMEFMGKILTNGHAEVAPKLQDGEECWYLPLFGVYHPKKPNKIRGVFDSSAKHNGISLNSVLFSGPDTNNSLLGVLLRFGKDQIAITADIEQMFYCFKVAKRHRNFLRFLWYQDNCLQNPLIEYRMTSHVFGNSPSPAVATYGLRKAVEDAAPDVRDFVTYNFYVDDGLISTPTAEIAISLVTRTQQTLMDNGNIKLHKVASNSPDVLKSLNQKDLAVDVKDLDLHSENPPLQRSLGLYWNLADDFFTFSSDAVKRPYTKRGLLATTNSLFDPIGFAAPVVLKGRLLFRDLMTSTADWDETLPEEHRVEWESWCESLSHLSSCHIQRQYHPGTIFNPEDNEVHIFSDASKDAISAVAYLRNRIAEDQYQVSFLLGKAKVALKHGHTIPRLELCAAVLATEVGRTIIEQLDITPDNIRFYTDSRKVLGYLWNRIRRFYIYVGNRVDRILRFSKPTQWSHVSTDQNPADEGTRCIQATDLQNSTWLQGPNFLRNEIQTDSEHSDCYPLIEPDNDNEVRPVVRTMKTTTSCIALSSSHFKNFSSWNSLVRGVAKLTSMINSRKRKDYFNILRLVTVQDLEDSQLFILRQTQQEAFQKEIKCLEESKPLPRNSTIIKFGTVFRQ